MSKFKTEGIFGVVVLVLFISFISLVGCGAINKPKVKDPCATAPTECWAGKGVNPNEVAQCVELVKCFSWEMRAK